MIWEAIRENRMTEAENNRFGPDGHQGVGAVRLPTTLEKMLSTTA